jgi:tricorn protease
MSRLLMAMLVLGLQLMTTSAAGEEGRLLRFPDVSSDHVAFVWASDIYVAPREGGQAIRLTSHEGLELFPRFSPDGNTIAFTAQYDGPCAVYTMPLSGGTPKRLTYHPGVPIGSERMGPDNVVIDWHPDGTKILFRSRRDAIDSWEGRVFWVDTSGGLPTPLPMVSAGFTSLSPEGDKVAFCPVYRDFRTWKRYKGGMAQDVWIFDMTDTTSEKITDWIGTDNVPMWYQDRIYFNSDRTGHLNLHCYDVSTGEIRQVTHYDQYDVRWPALGPDAIVFEYAGWLHVMDLPSEAVHKLTIHINSDRPLMRQETVDVSEMIREADISPDGKRIVVSARGELYSLPAKYGDDRNLTGHTSGSVESDPAWSPDGRWIAHISDRTGEDEVYLVSHDGTQTIQLTNDGYCRRYQPVWSPDSELLTLSDKDNNLWLVDVERRTTTKIDSSALGEINDYTWSPDSRWIAYSKPNENRLQSVFLYFLADKTVRPVTPDIATDYNPVFDPEGRYLYYLSDRDFNPLTSEYEFQFVNRSITNLYAVLLTRDAPDPFGPRHDEVTIGDAGSGSEAESKGVRNKDETKNRKPPAVVIDFDGIMQRQVAFDHGPGEYSNLTAIKGAVFFTSNPLRGLRGQLGDSQRELHKYDLAERKGDCFLSSIRDYVVSSSGEKMLIRTGRKQFHIVSTAGNKADTEDTRVPIGRLDMLLDRSAEYRQIFEDVWRQYRDFFYDPHMHGLDWQANKEKYRVLLPHAAHRFDLIYILGEMISELACSHTYVGGGDYWRPGSNQVGLLGADIVADQKTNRLRINRILRGEHWDENLRSPLRAPGAEVAEGDFLLAINGRELTAQDNPYRHLQNTVGKTVKLTVNSRPAMEGARTVSVEPLSGEGTLRYFDWVESRREYVDSASNSQFGYLHIPDMGGWGLLRFVRMFYHQARKPGLIMDVRYNGGGFVSQLILDRLLKRPVAMWADRENGVGPTPGTAIRGHMVTLLNEHSCSDGDIFPWCFREYGLGPLIGTRSWGGVVGIDGHGPLSDGGYVYTPEYAMFDLQGEWVIENVGVEPDSVVQNTPDRRTRDYDDQLDAAIRYLKNQLEHEPVSLPDRPDPPQPR